MNWDTIQQVLRILLYTGGGWLFGQSVADGAMYQAAVGGILSLGAFVWWYFWNRNTDMAPK